MSPLFSPSKKEISVIFDIGNGSVGLAVVEFQAGRQPYIHYTYREPLTFVPHLTPERLVETTLRLLKYVAEQFAAEALPRIRSSRFGSAVKDVFCVVSSPWYVAQTRVARHQQAKPFAVTAPFVEGLVKREQDQFAADLAASDRDAFQQLFGPDAKSLEKNVISTKLNGYDVASVAGKVAKEVEVTFFSSFIGRDFAAKAEEILASVFSFRRIRFHSYALASWTCIRDMYPSAGDFLCLDITGETTDVLLAKRGILRESVSFPSGRSLLVRLVAERLGISPEIALSYLKMHVEQTFSKAMAGKFEAAVAEAAASWLRDFVAAMAAVEAKYQLPKDVYLTVDADVAWHFIAALERQMPPELNLPEQGFSVSYLDEKAVQHFVEVDRYARPDAFLGLESVFVDRLLGLK